MYTQAPLWDIPVLHSTAEEEHKGITRALKSLKRITVNPYVCVSLEACPQATAMKTS